MARIIVTTVLGSQCALKGRKGGHLQTIFTAWRLSEINRTSNLSRESDGVKRRCHYLRYHRRHRRGNAFDGVGSVKVSVTTVETAANDSMRPSIIIQAMIFIIQLGRCIWTTRWHRTASSPKCHVCHHFDLRVHPDRYNHAIPIVCRIIVQDSWSSSLVTRCRRDSLTPTN